MRAVKAVKQNINNFEVVELLETFRRMVNDAIRVGLERNVTSRFSLGNIVYKQLHNGLHTWYILSAIEKACAILKNYRKAKRKNPETKKPYVRKAFLSIGNQGYKIIDGKLRLPIKPREYIYIPLNKHTLEVLSEPNLKLGSITLTARTVAIAFSKETVMIEPSGYIGIDRNLDNITTVSSDGEVASYDLSKATRIKAVYREVKSHLKRNDVRIRRRIFQKYGEKQRNRVNQILHHVSKDIVERAKKNKFGIVMENLKGIRKLYRKGNGQGRRYRGKMNSWSFYELQRQIEYKAKWEGVAVIYLSPQKTSSTCAICGSKILECTERQVYCPICKTFVDRDINAAKNILARGLRFKPVGLTCEAMVSIK
jgi:putative transposase